ncbi:MAG: ankyrin repeat domain-containing protein [Alphaproteobacteria bacterium]
MTTVTGVAGINITFGDEDEDNLARLDDALKELRAEADELQPAELLLKGAREGDLAKVKRALEGGAPVNSAAPNGDSALHLAVRSGEVQVVRHLILSQADVNAEDRRGYAPLNIAAERRHEVIGGMLLSSGANPEHLIPRINETPLITAAHMGCEKLVQRLITRRVNLDAQDCNGVTAVMRAAGGEHIECLELLLKAGANLELKSKTGSKMEDFAKRGKARKVLRALDSAENVQTALTNACEDGQLEAIRQALEAGADLNEPDGKGRRALQLAASRVKADVLEFLLEQKPDINAYDGPRNTALGNALQAKNYRAVKLLLDHGADAAQTVTAGLQTPLMLACATGDERLIDLVLQANNALDDQDTIGRTALMHLPPNQSSLMKKLLDLGANPALKDSAGCTLRDRMQKRYSPSTQFLETYLPELDARVQDHGSLRAIKPLKVIKVKMRTPGGDAP